MITLEEDPTTNEGVPTSFDFAILLELPDAPQTTEFEVDLTVEASVSSRFEETVRRMLGRFTHAHYNFASPIPFNIESILTCRWISTKRICRISSKLDHVLRRTYADGDSASSATYKYRRSSDERCTTNESRIYRRSYDHNEYHELTSRFARQEQPPYKRCWKY